MKFMKSLLTKEDERALREMATEWRRLECKD